MSAGNKVLRDIVTNVGGCLEQMWRNVPCVLSY